MHWKMKAYGDESFIVKKLNFGESEMKNIFDMEHGSVVDTNLQSQLLQRFITDETTDIVQERLSISVPLSNTYYGIVNTVKGLLVEGRIISPYQNPAYCMIMGKYKGNQLLIFVTGSGAGSRNDPDLDDEDEGAISLTIDIYGEPSRAADLQKKIGGLYEKKKMAKVRWWYKSDSRLTHQDIYLPQPTTTLHPEYYPDLGDPYRFMDEYLNSPSSILLMAGPPGTGKTTLLRHMIVERNLLAHVIYDEALMENDAVFQSFLFDKSSDLIVIEDADTLLQSREREGNKLMSRFLSVSDGLIKLPNKKVVFTTNISDFRNVDEALIRPGRCHAVVHTRPLNLTEAQAAAKVAGVPIPTEKGEYTLAELFNQGYRPQARQVGFGARH